MFNRKLGRDGADDADDGYHADIDDFYHVDADNHYHADAAGLMKPILIHPADTDDRHHADAGDPYYDADDVILLIKSNLA